jgi:hypothetical protein
MEKVLKYLQMVINMMDSISKENLVVMVGINGDKEATIKVTFPKVLDKVQVN